MNSPLKNVRCLLMISTSYAGCIIFYFQESELVVGFICFDELFQELIFILLGCEAPTLTRTGFPGRSPIFCVP